MLNLFPLKNNLNFCNVFKNNNLILYVIIQNFMTRNPTLLTWVVHTTYTQLDYHSTKYI